MKTIRLILILSLFSSVALATPKEINCAGKSEFDKVEIDSLAITNKKIGISYSKDGVKYFKGYRTKVFLRSNGVTDLRKTAYYIEGVNDSKYETITLPQYGEYKSGLGSHIAFDHKGARVIGVVSCTQK